MTDIKDPSCQPTVSEISAYIRNALFDKLYLYMEDKYKALCKIEYSKDVWLPGWNVKFKKAGKSLCVVYPNQGWFNLLVVVGKKEKESVELLLPQLSEKLKEIYNSTVEGNGQRWLMIELHSEDALFRDTLKLIDIRRACR